MSINKPNHVCKNADCKNGRDSNGNPCPKHYYACDYCDATENWHSVACCFECYQAYVSHVVAMRAADQKISLEPIRTDITKEQQAKIKKTPVKVLKEKAIKELSDFSDIVEAEGITAAVEAVNAQLDAETAQKISSKQIKE